MCQSTSLASLAWQFVDSPPLVALALALCLFGTLARPAPADLVKVEIDPDLNLPDVRRDNNVWVRR